MNAVLAIFFVGVENGLRVGSGLEGVTGGGQLGCQVAIVVDLPVEDDGRRAVLVKYGLFPAAQVDNAQPPESKPHRTFDEISVVIRAAVSETVSHLRDHRPVREFSPIEVYDPTDSAHMFFSSERAVCGPKSIPVAAAGSNWPDWLKYAPG